LVQHLVDQLGQPNDEDLLAQVEGMLSGFQEMGLVEETAA
jgi:hypothetical protein